MCVQNPYGYCDKTRCYVGETGRKVGVRLKEHRTEVEAEHRTVFARSQHAATASLAERNKSALIDHAVQENHVIS